MLMTDLSTDHQALTSPEQFGDRLFQCPLRAFRQGEYKLLVKDHTQRMPQPCPLRTSAFKARYPPALLPLSVLLTNFAPAGGLVQTTPRGCGQDCHSSGRVWVGERHSSKHLAADFCSCQSWPWLLLVPCNCLLHSLYVQTVGHKNCDIIGESGDPCSDTTDKGNSDQCQNCFLISKPTEQGLQGKDVEKRRQGATLLDQPLNCKGPQAAVQNADPSVELWFESGSLQNCHQKPMIHPIEGFGLI